MNRDRPEKIDQDCNVCGSAIEVGSAWSRCSNRDCPTRENEGFSDADYVETPSLSTDATTEEIAEYWEIRSKAAEADGPSQDEVDEAIEDAYEAFNSATDDEGRKQAEGKVQALLPFSKYEGFGHLVVAVGDVEV